MSEGWRRRALVGGLMLGALAASALVAQLAPEPPHRLFRLANDELGVDFRHHHGGSGEFYMVETMGAGVAILDYDQDGDQDLLFVDSGALPGYRGEPGRTTLYRNDGGRFVDATAASGLELASYGMGVVAADVDGDADVDLYFTAFGPNELWLNQGDGTFRRAAPDAGVAEELWGASAALADGDLDGDLDLYVTNYVDFGFDNNPICGDKDRGLRSYCHPDSFDGLPDRYFVNRGDGTFEERTEEAGFGGARGAGLGVVFTDLDGDGWPDVYVANDMNPNLLFVNRGDGTFEERGLLAGVALGQRGEPEAGMGIAVGDLDGDGGEELFVTHLDQQTNALYSAVGSGLFLDRRFAARVAEPSVYKVGFGTAFADLDLDGDLDIVIANGHIIHNVAELGKGGSYRQRNQVLVNTGEGLFEELEESGLDVVRSSRGLAVGDLDGDGDLDLAISNSNEAAEVYLNRTDPADGWLAVVPIPAPGPTPPPGGTGAIGARIVLDLDGVRQVRLLMTGSSYLSQHAAGAHFGARLGDAVGGATAGAPQVGRWLEIDWPGGGRLRLADPPLGRRLHLPRRPTPPGDG